MTKEQARYTIRAGMAVRRPIRRYLLQKGFKFCEDKGWFDSMFYVDCTQDEYNSLAQDLEPLNN